MNQRKKILVIQTAFPGDAILTLPFIQELKKHKADYKIEVLCVPNTKEIFEASPFVDEVITLDKKGNHKSFFSLLKFIKELKQRDYKIIYSPHRSLRTSIIVLGIRADESYGFENSSLKFAYKYVVKYDPSVHEVKRNLQLLNDNYNDEKWRILPEIVISSETKSKVSDFLEKNRISKFITIAPGSVWETKRYPVEYFKKINEFFLAQKYQIVLIGGSEDVDLCTSLQNGHAAEVHICARNFSFIDTIELLKHSSLLICNDSAPTHLGMFAGIPVLTIYCSTIPGFGFYPYNNKSDFVTFSELQCKPCGIHGYHSCPVDTFDCAKLLDPQRVIEKANRLLENEFQFKKSN